MLTLCPPLLLLLSTDTNRALFASVERSNKPMNFNDTATNSYFVLIKVSLYTALGTLKNFFRNFQVASYNRSAFG